jgi:hypothetical protein
VIQLLLTDAHALSPTDWATYRDALVAAVERSRVIAPLDCRCSARSRCCSGCVRMNDNPPTLLGPPPQGDAYTAPYAKWQQTGPVDARADVSVPGCAAQPRGMCS